MIVVSGAGAREKAYEAIAREQFRMFEPRLTLTYLSGLPTPDLERQLATLPENSIILYLLVYQDGAGQNFLPIGTWTAWPPSPTGRFTPRWIRQSTMASSAAA